MKWQCALLQRWLPEYPDGDLPALGKRWLKSHVARCSACRQELAELREMVAAIEAISGGGPGAGILARIFPGYAPEAGPGRPGRPDCTRPGQPPAVSAALSPGSAGPGSAAALCGGAAHGARRPHSGPGPGKAAGLGIRRQDGCRPPEGAGAGWPRSPPPPPCRWNNLSRWLWRKVRPCRWRKWIFPAGTWMRNWRE